MTEEPFPASLAAVPVPGAADSSHWMAIVQADAEPALLARLLQKLMCQQAVIRQLRYDRAPGDHAACIAVIFDAESSRAELLARQWRALITVRSVELTWHGSPDPCSP